MTGAPFEILADVAALSWALSSAYYQRELFGSHRLHFFREPKGGRR